MSFCIPRATPSFFWRPATPPGSPPFGAPRPERPRDPANPGTGEGSAPARLTRAGGSPPSSPSTTAATLTRSSETDAAASADYASRRRRRCTFPVPWHRPSAPPPARRRPARFGLTGRARAVPRQRRDMDVALLWLRRLGGLSGFSLAGRCEAVLEGLGEPASSRPGPRSPACGTNQLPGPWHAAGGPLCRRRNEY